MAGFEGSNQSPFVDRALPFRFIALHLSPRLSVCGKRAVMGVAGALKLRTNPRGFKRRLCARVHARVLVARGNGE